MNTYNWKFRKFAGVLQVILEDADDILHLKELDLKLWSVLALPTGGVFIDKETLLAIDTDNDGFIRPIEIFEAIDFLSSALHDLSPIFSGTINLKNIKDESILHAFLSALKDDEKTEADGSTLKNICALLKECDENSAPEKAILKMLQENEGAVSEKIKKMKELFLKCNAVFRENNFSFSSLAEACEAFENVEKKMDDFFLRESLNAYASSLKNPFSDFAEEFKEIKKNLLTENSAALKELPLSFASSGSKLALHSSINPAWQNEILSFYQKTVVPILGERDFLVPEEWQILKEKISSLSSFLKEAKKYDVENSALFEAEEEKILKEIENVKGKIKQKESLLKLKKLLLLTRDFFCVLKNFVNFEDFYSKKLSVFQSGVLYFDSKATSLCFEYSDESAHTKLDLFSGAYLLYCKISRSGEEKKIIAVLTNGSSVGITSGRHGIFYDREGKDWQATVEKVMQNPISIKEAFFTPYRNFVRMTEQFFQKKAGDAEQKGAALLSNVGKTDEGKKDEAKKSGAKKADLATIALIGTAVGGISTLVLGVFRSAVDLGFYLPVAILAIVLIISGPSMILAAIKLHRRNITPILEANGWALNASLKINIPFGAYLTKQLSLPPSAHLSLVDPFSKKKKAPVATIAFFIALLLAASAFYFLKTRGSCPLSLLRRFIKWN